FSYYGMRALLILFMTAPAASVGLGMDVASGAAVYGLYTSGVYMMCLPGGWMADRILGKRRAVWYGGLLIASGHYAMAVPTIATFYVGLVLIVLGTGLLKPNISAIVGDLYERDDERRDSGFSIFYMGINLGAFIAPLACGYVGQRVDWHMGFGLAGIGMTLGLIQYRLGARHLGNAGVHPAPAESEAAARRDRTQARWGVVAMLLIPLLLLAISKLGLASISATALADAFGVLLLILVAGVFAGTLLLGGWMPLERKRLFIILVLFLAASLFWSVFEQAGSTLNLFAQRSTETRLLGVDFPSSWLQSVNSLFLISLAPVFAWLWIRLRSSDPSVTAKFVLGLVCAGLGFAVMWVAANLSASGVKISPMWLILTYFLHTAGELCLSPVGLSAMTKLAPARIVSLMMGVWFLATSVGNYAGSRMAGLYEALPLETLFGAIAIFAVALGLLLGLFVRPITRLAGGVR
ncbi:MAG: peptide MFS transporter, partial [Bryobacteraceae bacterium]